MTTTNYNAGDCIPLDTSVVECINWKNGNADAVDVECLYLGSKKILDLNEVVLSEDYTQDEANINPTVIDSDGNSVTTGSNGVNMGKPRRTKKLCPKMTQGQKKTYWQWATRTYKCPANLAGTTKASVFIDWHDPANWPGSAFSTSKWMPDVPPALTRVYTASSNKYLVTAGSQGPFGPVCLCQNCLTTPTLGYHIGSGCHNCSMTQWCCDAGAMLYRAASKWGDDTVTNTNAPTTVFSCGTKPSTSVVRFGFAYAPGGYVSHNLTNGCKDSKDKVVNTNGIHFLGWAHYDPTYNLVVVTYGLGVYAGNGSAHWPYFFKISDGRKIIIVKGGRNTNGPGMTGSIAWDASA